MVIDGKVIHKHKGRSLIKYKEDSNGCWICTSHKPRILPNGDISYHQIRLGSAIDNTRRVALMHRYIYELYNGEIPDKLVVRHDCDNPRCINPNHLRLGTHQDNANDMVSRNRSAKGDKNGSAKLTNEKVIKMRQMHSTGKYSHKELSLIFGVSRRQVNNIIRRKSFSNI